MYKTHKPLYFVLAIIGAAAMAAGLLFVIQNFKIEEELSSTLTSGVVQPLEQGRGGQSVLTRSFLDEDSICSILTGNSWEIKNNQSRYESLTFFKDGTLQFYGFYGDYVSNGKGRWYFLNKEDDKIINIFFAPQVDSLAPRFLGKITVKITGGDLSFSKFEYPNEVSMFFPGKESSKTTDKCDFMQSEKTQLVLKHQELLSAATWKNQEISFQFNNATMSFQQSIDRGKYNGTFALADVDNEDSGTIETSGEYEFDSVFQDKDRRHAKIKYSYRFKGGDLYLKLLSYNIGFFTSGLNSQENEMRLFRE